MCVGMKGWGHFLEPLFLGKGRGAHALNASRAAAGLGWYIVGDNVGPTPGSQHMDRTQIQAPAVWENKSSNTVGLGIEFFGTVNSGGGKGLRLQ